MWPVTVALYIFWLLNPTLYWQSFCIRMQWAPSCGHRSLFYTTKTIYFKRFFKWEMKIFAPLGPPPQYIEIKQKTLFYGKPNKVLQWTRYTNYFEIKLNIRKRKYYCRIISMIVLNYFYYIHFLKTKINSPVKWGKVYLNASPGIFPYHYLHQFP